MILEDVSIHRPSENEAPDMGRLTGEAIRTVRESISQGFLDWSPRIMLAMYSCEIQASSICSTSPPPSPSSFVRQQANKVLQLKSSAASTASSPVVVDGSSPKQ